MAYIAIEDFKYGVDRRKSRIAGVPGSLWVLENAHITRGGEIERCKKFVPTYTLPAGQTLGFFGARKVLYVFGSAEGVVVPAGVTYQRLQHPGGPSYTLTEVLDVQPFNGTPYVSAKFSDGSIWQFHNGVLVTDQGGGITFPYIMNYAGLAAYFANQINLDGRYTAVANGDTLVVTAVNATAFTYGTYVIGNNQSVIPTLIQAPIAATAETAASAVSTVNSGTSGSQSIASFDVAIIATSKTVTSVKYGATELLGATVSGTSQVTMATAVVNQINAYSSQSGGFTASLVASNTVRVFAPLDFGAIPNGVSLVVAGTLASGGFVINNTAFSGGVSNGVTSITVNGVEILGKQKIIAGTLAAFAAAVAAQISNYVSSPEYVANTAGPALTILAGPGQGAAANGRTVNITTIGACTFSSTSFNLAGGVNGGISYPQIVSFKFGSSYVNGAKFGLKLTQGADTQIYGAEGQPDQVGDVLLLLKNKMYSGRDSIVDFSSVGNSDLWSRDRNLLGVAGMGFINVSNQDEGTQTVTALGRYGGQLAIFSETSIQIWNMFADPTQNSYDSTLDNTGTKAKKSVRQFGNTDLFYLDVTGIRSLRARATTNAAFANDIGSPIDSLVQSQIELLTDAVVSKAFSIIEPYDARYWLNVNDTIYVLSYFPASKISAWSYYKPGFSISEFVRDRNNLYCRAGDQIYQYGGVTGHQYPDAGEMPVTVETPYLTAGKVATRKMIQGFDAGIENTWKCEALIDLNRPDSPALQIGNLNKSTYNQPYIRVKAKASHVALRMTCAKAGYAKISNIALHFAGEGEKAG